MLLEGKLKKKIFILGFILPILLIALFLNYKISPVSGSADYFTFSISKGDSLDAVATRLGDGGVIRSPLAFKVLGFMTGASTKIQPGRYELSPHLSAPVILNKLSRGGNGSISITIPEGLTIYEVDNILSDASVIKPGELVSFSKKEKIEGRLFPDTYKFLPDTKIDEVVDVFLANFNKKAMPILTRDLKNLEINLTLASILQEEIPDPEEQKIASGILKKRIAAGMPLQVDSSICYAKRAKLAKNWSSCYPLTSLDMKINSPYNTYLYKGWPPGPIASPGLSAVLAAVEPADSPYWFYLSDPLTKRTVFAEDLEDHNRNITTFLKS